MTGTVEDLTLTDEERVNIRVYARANRGVVNITTRTVRPDQVFMFDVPEEGNWIRLDPGSKGATY